MAKRTGNIIQRNPTTSWRGLLVLLITTVGGMQFSNHGAEAGKHDEEIKNQVIIIQQQREIKELLKSYKSDAMAEAIEIHQKLDDVNDYMRDHHH